MAEPSNQDVSMTVPTEQNIAMAKMSDQTVTSTDAESADKFPATDNFGHGNITALVTETFTTNDIFGYLRLLSAELEKFQCRKSLLDMISLTSLHSVLKAAVWYSDDSVLIFAKFGSKQLFFQRGKNALDFALGLPISVDLHYAGPDYRMFPNVTYGLEAATISSILTDTLTEVLHTPPKCRPSDVKLYSRPAAVQMIGNLVSASILDDEQDFKDLNLVRMNWNSMESLNKALQMAVYLLTSNLVSWPVSCTVCHCPA